MNPSVSLLAVLAMALMIKPAAGEEPISPVSPAAPVAPLTWTDHKGRTMTGNFVRLSGDELVIEQDGREFSFSVSRLSQESARLARKLAGVEEPPPPPAEQPSVPALRPMVFIQVGKGRFKMGSPSAESGRQDDETQHMVKIGRDFEMKATEVTWAEWNAVLDLASGYGYIDISAGFNGHGGDEGGRHPVLGISWWDAIKWCNLKSQIEDRQVVYFTHSGCNPTTILQSGTEKPYANWNANGYRLPTEAEWEFACRPGTSDRAFHTGPITGKPDDANLNEAGWYASNSGGNSHPVADKDPNRLGLHDMHGNAAEWCWDLAGPLGATEAFDPRGALHGETRIIRGGSWNDPPKFCRAASRISRVPTFTPNQFVGFRLVRGTK